VAHTWVLLHQVYQGGDWEAEAHIGPVATGAVVLTACHAGQPDDWDLAVAGRHPFYGDQDPPILRDRSSSIPSAAPGIPDGD
jgi:hypothetical protein